MRATLAIAILLALTCACAGSHGNNPDIWLTVTDYSWSGGTLPAGATVTVTIYEQAEGAAEWTQIDAVPWPDVTVPLRYEYTRTQTPTRYRFDVASVIEGETYAFSCVTEYDWLGATSADCGVEER